MATNGTSVLDALADPTRRAVLDLIRLRPRSVTEIAAELPVSRPAVSQHLRALRAARLVTDRPEGTRRIYSLDPRGLAELRDYVDRLWRTAMASFVEYAEHEYGGGTPSASSPSTRPGGTP